MIIDRLTPNVKALIRYSMLLSFVLQSYPSSATNPTKPSLVGNWIKVNITYSNGKPLEEQHPSKYSFLKYSFKPDKKAAIVTNFLSEGEFAPYQVNFGTIEISTRYGSKVKLKTAYLTQDSLVVIQEGPLGRNDPGSLSITFVRYEHLQDISEWGPKDYVSTIATDTVYKTSSKIHPLFLKPGGFNYALQKNVKSYIRYIRTSKKNDLLFCATFIVKKSGGIENIKIIKGLDEQFNKEFIKTCEKTEKNWDPAQYNNKPVDSQVTLIINSEFSSSVLRHEKYSYHAVQQFEKGNIENAITYLDKLLSYNPKNEKALIFRGQCYLELNDPETACDDFSVLKSLGYTSGEALLQKHCK